MVATVFAATAILSPPRWCCGFAPLSRRFRRLPVLFRTIFHRVEVPEQGDSVAPTQPTEMASPFGALKKSAGSGAAASRSERLFTKSGITCRENQERQRATQF